MGMDARSIRRGLSIAFVLGIVAAPRLLLAHEVESDEAVPESVRQLLTAWAWEPGTIIGLGISGWLYVVGMVRLWRASGEPARKTHRWQAWCFAAGWITLLLALLSPIHPLGQILFSAHMVQHEILMLLAAPLLVLGRPMVVFLHGMPTGLAHELGRFSNTAFWRGIWGTISAPLIAWLLHLVVLWMWHAPALFQATLHSEWMHAAQHISFLLSALLFWWALIHGHHGVKNYGAAVLYLFTTAIHSGLLGALLTFSRSPWYPDYDHAQIWGMTALEDQQLGGLIMWVPACTVYIIAGLIMFAGWLQRSDQLAKQWQTISRAPDLVNERSYS